MFQTTNQLQTPTQEKWTFNTGQIESGKRLTESMPIKMKNRFGFTSDATSVWDPKNPRKEMAHMAGSTKQWEREHFWWHLPVLINWPPAKVNTPTGPRRVLFSTFWVVRPGENEPCWTLHLSQTQIRSLQPTSWGSFPIESPIIKPSCLFSEIKRKNGRSPILIQVIYGSQR